MFLIPTFPKQNPEVSLLDPKRYYSWRYQAQLRVAAEGKYCNMNEEHMTVTF